VSSDDEGGADSDSDSQPAPLVLRWRVPIVIVPAWLPEAQQPTQPPSWEAGIGAQHVASAGPSTGAGAGAGAGVGQAGGSSADVGASAVGAAASSFDDAAAGQELLASVWAARLASSCSISRAAVMHL